jgi:hypothetical protein
MRFATAAASLALCVAAAGCASLGGDDLATASVPETVQPAPRVNPACVSLAAHIDQLRKEGTVERVEKAADGKTTVVNVKRASLAKVAELNRANAEFQAKCSTITPRQQTAVVTPPPASAPAVPKAVPAKSSAGVAAVGQQ